MQRRRASSSQGVRQNDIHQLGMRHGYLLVLLLAAESWRQRFVPLPFHWVYLEHAFFQLIMPTLVPHKVINPNHGVHFHTCQGIIHHLASFYPLRWARQHFTLGDYCRMMQEYSLLNTGFKKKCEILSSFAFRQPSKSRVGFARRLRLSVNGFSFIRKYLSRLRAFQLQCSALYGDYSDFGKTK